MRKQLFLTLLVLSLTPAAFGDTTRLSGEAVVRSVSPNHVAVFLDTTGDRVIDQGFLLSADIPTGSGLAVHLEEAEVEFNNGYVRVASQGRYYDLVVAGYPDPPAAPASSRVVTMIGYALVHSTGDSGCSIERAHERDADSCYGYGRD